ncbi:MAG: esterase family protein [Acidobacteria bacterium]|nr:esterase family protein [Acidobacteriota bacterium]
MKFLKNVRILFLVLLLAAAAFAQNPPTMSADKKPVAQQTAGNSQDLKLASKLMAREMPYRVILPVNYAAEKDRKYAVLYLLHGLTGHFDNWGDKTKIGQYAAGYDYIVVMPEGNNGWYVDSATVPTDKYESYILQELIPEIDAKFRTLADREHRVVAGLSMGGYGSLKFGLKFPDKFVLAGSFSGALVAGGWTTKSFEATGMKGPIPDSIKIAFGADDSTTRADNDIFKMVRETTPEKAKTLPFLYVDCGTEDFLIAPNREFAGLLLEKKIPHEFRERPGMHDWKFWDASIYEFLALTKKYVR